MIVIYGHHFMMCIYCAIDDSGNVVKLPLTIKIKKKHREEEKNSGTLHFGSVRCVCVCVCVRECAWISGSPLDWSLENHQYQRSSHIRITDGIHSEHSSC